MTYDFHRNLFTDNPTNISDEYSKLLFKFYRLYRILLAYDKKNISSSISAIIHTKCNLQCSYCYESVDSKVNDNQVMDIDALVSVMKRFDAKNLNLIGGEASLDFKYVETLLKKVGRLDTLRLTTNGTFLTNELLNLLLDSSENVSVGMSFEPKKWNNRLTKANSDIHQNYLIKKQFEKLDLNLLFKSKIKFGASVVVDFTEDKYISVDEILEELYSIFSGNRPYAVRWNTVEKVSSYNLVNNLRLLNDEFYEISNHSEFDDRMKLGPQHKLLNFIDMASKNSIFQSLDFSCNPGIGSLSFNKYNKLYTCSVDSTDETKSDIPNNATLEDIFTSTIRHHLNLLDDNCYSCSSKFLCGKTCLEKTQSRCEFHRTIVAVTLEKLKKFFPNEFEIIKLKQSKLHEKINQNLPLIKSIVESSACNSIMSGIIDNNSRREEYIECLNMLRNILT